MKFVRIEMLFLIWAIPVFFLILLFGMKRRKKILSRYASNRGLAAIAHDVDPKRRWIRAGLILSSMALITVALSGPQYGYKWETVERRGIDIMIALDCSKSMLAKDVSPNRLERAKRKIYDLLDMLQGDRIGLVAFAGTAFLQCPLTLDYQAFDIFLKALSPDEMPVGGTDIPDAVTTAISGFQKKVASKKAIILITDGGSTQGDPVKAARLAQKDGIKLFCIGVGGKEGVPVPDEHGGFIKDSAGNIVMTRLDEATLEKMAAITGGTYVRSIAGDLDLDTIYKKEIRGQMKLATLSSRRKQVWEDRYQWLLAPAILALLVELFLSDRKKTIVLLLMAGLLLPAGQARAAAVNTIIRRGMAAYEKKDYHKALKLFIDAQLEKPDLPEIYYNIGNADYKIGKYDAARQNYKQALKTKNKTLCEKSRYNLGNTAYRQGKFKDAVSNYQAALKIDPNDTQAKENLDFVKKMMEQEKKHAGQPGKSDKNQHIEKNGAHKEGAGKKPQRPEKSDKSDQKNAKANALNSQKPEKGNSGKDKGFASNAPDNKKNSDIKSAPEHTQNLASAAKPQQDQKGGYQSENVLNRLQDIPGRAMMPFYHEQETNKDW
jgi:Ca-activated chloride channel homolog